MPSLRGEDGRRYRKCETHVRTASIITKRTELVSRRNVILVGVEKYLGLINCSVPHAKRMGGLWMPSRWCLGIGYR